jgi:hypothetical protein
MGRYRACLLVLTALLLAACGSTKHAQTRSETTVNRNAADEAAARLAVRVQAELKQGRFAAAWRTLHPAERRLISAQRLASCYPAREFPRRVTFRAHEATDVRWTVPGTNETTDAKEISVTATSPGQPKQSFKQHVVLVGGTWRWMLNSAYFERAKNGRC